MTYLLDVAHRCHIHIGRWDGCYTSRITVLESVSTAAVVAALVSAGMLLLLLATIGSTTKCTKDG